MSTRMIARFMMVPGPPLAPVYLRRGSRAPACAYYPTSLARGQPPPPHRRASDGVRTGESGTDPSTRVRRHRVSFERGVRFRHLDRKLPDACSEVGIERDPEPDGTGAI